MSEVDKAKAEIERFFDKVRGSSDSTQEYYEHIKSEGTFPRAIIPILLEILKKYFQKEPNYPEIQRLLPKLSQGLNNEEVDDVHYLYFESIRINGRPEYLALTFLQLLSAEFSNIGEKLKALATVLVINDPSHVVHDCPALVDAYRPLFANGFGHGPLFSFSDFKRFFFKFKSALSLDASVQLQQKINIFFDGLENESEFSDKILFDLKQIYDCRWDNIKGREDYTKVVSNPKRNSNVYWILLAQFLSGARKIPENYYTYLMYTLVQPINILRNQPLESAPLSHYVLSADCTRLISLKDMIEYGDPNNSAIDRTFGRVAPLKPEEIERIQYANKRFQSLFRLCTKEKYKELPVKRATVHIVHRLLLKSLDNAPNSVLDEKAYNDHVKKTENAYLEFSEALSNLRCHAQVYFLNSDSQSIPAHIVQQVIAQEKVLFIRNEDHTFTLGFCNKQAKYETKNIGSPEFLKAYADKSLIKTEEYCCIKINNEPKQHQLSQLLGRYQCGYIRVVNTDVNKLYFANILTNELVLISITNEQLATYDTDLDGKDSPRPQALTMIDLGRIRLSTGHIIDDDRCKVDAILSSTENSALTRLDEELYRLYMQKIYWDGSTCTIYETLSRIELGPDKRGCITEHGKSLLFWVLNYFPELEVNSDLAERDPAAVKRMRECSERRHCSDSGWSEDCSQESLGRGSFFSVNPNASRDSSTSKAHSI